MLKLTDSQRQALTWLQERNSTGLFDKTGVLIAGGDRSETMRSTWNRLRDLGLVTIATKRVTLTNDGRAMDARKPHRIVADSILARTSIVRAPLLSDEEDEA